jgi:predicted dehydrogenase
MSLILLLFGMPVSMYYERGLNGSGLVTFRFESGAIASLALTRGASINGGMEHTTIISDNGRHISVENNVRVVYHRIPRLAYGSSPSFYVGAPDETSAVWEPEFSLGQLYNKGLFLLGYYNEINGFARSILEGRAPSKGTLKHAWGCTRVFEAFADGPGKAISLE